MFAFRRFLTLLTLGLCLCAAAGGGRSLAEPAKPPTWPTRTVRFILTLGPGSGADIGARLIADRLAKKWSQPVVVENRPGGDGIVAISAFIGTNDDHVLLLTPTSSFIAHPWTHTSIPYKPSELAPVARISNTVLGLSVPSVLPVNSLADLIALVKSKPGELNWAGVASGLDFNFESWLRQGGLEVKKVPYRNPVDAVNDLAQNRVQIYGSAVAIVQPQIQAGHVKLLLIANSERTSVYPNIPTAREAGQPGLTIDGLIGLFARPSMPMALRQQIAADVTSVIENDPIIKDRLNATAQIPSPGSPEEFAQEIEKQRALITQNAKDLGIERKFPSE